MSQRRRPKSLSQPSTSRANRSDEIDVEITTMTQTQDKSMSDEEHAQNVANAVKYILGTTHIKAPIQRTNIAKCINCHGPNFKAVMKSAQDVLLKTFGYKLEEVDLEKKSGKYILYNTIQNSYLQFEVPVRERYTLLFLVLSHIFMNGEMCTQASLEGFLRQLGIITEGNVKSDVFGDVLNLILVDFVKEKYIATKKSDTTENEIELTWGQKAEKEVSARSVLEFVSQVFDSEPTKWPTQHQRMLEIEQQEMRAGGTQNHVENGMEE